MQRITEWIRGYWWIPLLLALIIFLDQWTKHLANHFLTGNRVFTIIPNFFDFSLAYNTGAAFGFGRNWAPLYRNIVFLGVSCFAVGVMVVLLFQVRNRGWLPNLAITLILSGAIGNLIDRFRLGYVVDFIHVFYRQYHWPNFNIADSSICVGISLFAIYLLWGDNKES